MSEESTLPPKVQQRLLRFQQLQQQLQGTLLRKQQVQLELMEVENALKELEGVEDDVPIYKAVGALLVRAEKPKVVQELEDRREFLKLRLEQLEREENRLREQIEELRARLRKDLSAQAGVGL
ncbi:MAG TPA: prefoldin subunit beta [Candidatus Bathyarchaeota archaeon]|nr:prefoldin subunit beta [Candidatus Bathyarchaeota archaeon]HEW89946.1 prefoldin subunit beta [Candidatus Bathyarchaeota archaeon]